MVWMEVSGFRCQVSDFSILYPASAILKPDT